MFGNYDSWKATDPSDEGTARDPRPCTHCGTPVADVEVAWCMTCLRYTQRPAKPQGAGR